MAEVVVTPARDLFMLRCPECIKAGGQAAPLSGGDAGKDPYRLSREHNKATGHHSYIQETDDAMPGFRAGHRVLLILPR